MRDKSGFFVRAVPFAGPLTVRVSAFADGITVFVYYRLEGCEEGGWRVRADSRR